MALQNNLKDIEKKLSQAVEKLDAISEAFTDARRDVDIYSFEKTMIEAYMKIEQDVDNIFLPTAWICENVRGLQYLLEMMLSIQPTITQQGKKFIFTFNKVGYGKDTGTSNSRGYRNCAKTFELAGYPASGYYFTKDNVRLLLTKAAEYPNDKNIFLAVVLLLSRLEEKNLICTTYQYIADQLGCSTSAVKKVIYYLIDNNLLIRIHAGTIFTTGSVYKFNPENVFGNLKLTNCVM